MKYIFIVIYINVFGCISQSKNSINVKNEIENDTIVYYKDFNFSTFEGIEPVEKYDSDAFIQILLKDKHKVILKVYQKEIYPEVYSKYDKDGNCINCSNKYFEFTEEFENKGNYFYQLEIHSDDIPGSTVHIHKYFNYTKNEIILIKLFFENKLPESFYSITKVSLKSEQTETISFSEKWNEDILTPNIDFDLLKKYPAAYSYDLKKFERSKEGIIIDDTSKDLKNDINTNTSTLFRGFPTKEVNSFWNLYRGYYSSEVYGFNKIAK